MGTAIIVRITTTMAISPLILLVLLSLSKAAPTEDSMIPGVINNLVERGVDVVTQWVGTYTTAPYTVTQTHTGGVEERLYPAMSWMCNKRTENTESDIQRSSLFWPLFSYIQGGNADLTMIPMTIPVTTLLCISNRRERGGLSQGLLEDTWILNHGRWRQRNLGMYCINRGLALWKTGGTRLVMTLHTSFGIEETRFGT